MRRLMAFMAILGILMIPPLIASAEMSYENMTTITATTATLDASFGAMGPGTGTAMLNASDNGVTMPADNIYVCDTYFYLRAKGSGDQPGIQPICASALMTTYCHNGYNYDAPVTYCCLRAKGSAEPGIQRSSASALVSSYSFCFFRGATANNYNFMNMAAGIDGGNCTSQRRTNLRC